MKTATTESLVSSSLNYIYLDKLVLEDAKKKYIDYQNEGVIIQGYCFDDNTWKTTDEYSNVGFHFRFDIFSYNKYKPLFNMELNEFISYLKAYLISLFGKNALETIRCVLLDIRRIMKTSPDDIYGTTKEIRLYAPNLCSDFFSLLPISGDESSLDSLIDAMDSYAENNLSDSRRNQRTLSDMETYFKFDEIIQEYWKKDITTEERLFYYPLYLWWVLTAVLPLRPREFLLTGRNCLNIDNKGDYYLTLRRNQLKGSNRHHSYKVDGDYSSDTYKIPTNLGEEIRKYQSLTANFDNTEIDTLFVTDPHYKKWGQRKHSDSRFLTYTNMNTILKYFYKEVIEGIYNYKTIYESNDIYLNDNQIGYIHLGDTRHIALINLMQEGGTPMTAMFLAGHVNTIMASHYYSNITRLIECKTYREYRRLAAENNTFSISITSNLPKVGDFVELSNGSRCYSSVYKDGKITDCLNSIGDNGEIGYCPNCIYYRSHNISYFSSDDIYKRNIKNDYVSLKNAIELIRAGKGDIEDIGEALLKLKSSSTSYETYLLEKRQRGK